jgi:endonuclease G
MRLRISNRTIWLIVIVLVIVAVNYFLPNNSGQNTPGAAPSGATGSRNLALGNPSDAVHDAAQPDNYLIERPQYALSYSRDRAIPNWVSWQLSRGDMGAVQRSNEFVPDGSLPAGWPRIQTEDYNGSGYDRGHMCPSGDRTATTGDNEATFILTNILPQAPDNNRETWEHLESYSRELANKGHVLYIIAGGDGSLEKIKGRLTVPAYTWKIVVVAPRGDGSIASITADTPVIAVRIPNDKNLKIGDWEQYRVKVSAIETVTGYHFFTNLPPAVQTALKSRIDPPPAN